MYNYRANYRVCYADTDRMGHMYYGAYARVLEIARVEAIRSLGLSYAELEAQGLILPVRSYNIKFIHSALYDQLLNIDTTIPVYPDNYKLEFDYRILCPENQLLAKAKVELYILDAENKKPSQLPAVILASLKPHF